MPQNSPFRFPDEPKSSVVHAESVAGPSRSSGEALFTAGATRVLQSNREQNGDLPLEPADLPTGEAPPFTNVRGE